MRRNGFEEATKADHNPVMAGKIFINYRRDDSASHALAVAQYFETIPRSRHDPKILGRDDAEVVGDRIAEVRPIARNLFAQETERRVGELRTSCVAFVVRNVSMHQAP